MYAIASTLAESTYTGYSLIVMIIGLMAMVVFMISMSMIVENNDYKNGLRVLFGSLLVIGLILSFAPLQTNSDAHLNATEDPDTYLVEDLDYEYEYSSDVTVRVTDPSVDRIKVFSADGNSPVDKAERLQDSPKTTLDLPESDSIVIITYNEDGATVEETQIQLDEDIETVPIIDFETFSSI